jgi:hypothetical protein
MDSQREIQQWKPCGDSFSRREVIAKTLAKMALRRSVALAPSTLSLYVEDLCDLGDSVTTDDVVNAISKLSMQVREAGESAWPEVGRIIDLAHKERIARQNRERNTRLLLPPPAYQPPDAELEAQYAAFAARTGIPRHAPNPTQPPQPSTPPTPTHGESIEAMEHPELTTSHVFAMLDLLMESPEPAVLRNIMAQTLNLVGSDGDPKNVSLVLRSLFDKDARRRSRQADETLVGSVQ